MRWLLDQGLPRSAALLLREQGEEAVHVGEITMGDAADAAILSHALKDGRVVITLDADFHALLALSGARGPSVVRVREEGLKAPELVALMHRIERQFAGHLKRGVALTVLGGTVRYRKLPLR